jgi:hypothetical protein
MSDEEMGRRPDPEGPFPERIDVSVTEDMKLDAALLARAHGFKSLGNWVRHVLSRELYGEVHMVEKYLHRGRNSRGANPE